MSTPTNANSSWICKSWIVILIHSFAWLSFDFYNNLQNKYTKTHNNLICISSADEFGRCRWNTNAEEPMIFIKYQANRLNILDVEKQVLTLKNDVLLDDRPESKCNWFIWLQRHYFLQLPQSPVIITSHFTPMERWLIMTGGLSHCLSDIFSK